MSAATTVARGRAWLNENYPGWDRYINLDDLSLTSPTCCVLGQLAAKDPRLEPKIAAWDEKRRERLIKQGWNPDDIRPVRRDFFAASFAMDIPVDYYGFDADDDEDAPTLRELENEWYDVIEEEQAQWVPLSG